MPFLVPTLNQKWNKLYLKSLAQDSVRTQAAAMIVSLNNIQQYGDGNGDYVATEQSLLLGIRSNYDSALRAGYELMQTDYHDIMKVINKSIVGFDDLMEELSKYMHLNSLWYKSRVIAYTPTAMTGTKVDMVYCETDKRAYKFEDISPGLVSFECIADYNTGASRYGQEQFRVTPDRQGYDFIESIDRTNLTVDAMTLIDSLSSTLLMTQNQSFQNTVALTGTFPYAITSTDELLPWSLDTGVIGGLWVDNTIYFNKDDVQSKEGGRSLGMKRVGAENIYELSVEPQFSLDTDTPYFFRCHVYNGLNTTDATVEMIIGSVTKTHTISNASPNGWETLDFYLDENCWYDAFTHPTATPIEVSIKTTFNAASDLVTDLLYLDDIIFAEFDFLGNLPFFLVRGYNSPIVYDTCSLSVAYTDSCLRQKVLAQHFNYYLPHKAAGYITESGLIP